MRGCWTPPSIRTRTTSQRPTVNTKQQQPSTTMAGDGHRVAGNDHWQRGQPEEAVERWNWAEGRRRRPREKGGGLSCQAVPTGWRNSGGWSCGPSGRIRAARSRWPAQTAANTSWGTPRHPFLPPRRLPTPLQSPLSPPPPPRPSPRPPLLHPLPLTWCLLCPTYRPPCRPPPRAAIACYPRPRHVTWTWSASTSAS